MRRLAVLAWGSLAAAATGCGGSDRQASSEPGGDPGRGRQVYVASACGACHTFAAVGRGRNVGPDLDEVVRRYDARFIRRSIVEPDAFVERGEAGSIGGDRPYGTRMPAYGPDEKPPQHLSEQQLADLIAFLTSKGDTP